MIKNVIFDCGRVLVHYNEVYIASFFTDNAEDAALLGRVGMARKYWERFDQGVWRTRITKERSKRSFLRVCTRISIVFMRIGSAIVPKSKGSLNLLKM